MAIFKRRRITAVNGFSLPAEVPCLNLSSYPATAKSGSKIVSKIVSNWSPNRPKTPLKIDTIDF
jgi:hypothetical protein